MNMRECDDALFCRGDYHSTRLSEDLKTNYIDNLRTSI